MRILHRYRGHKCNIQYTLYNGDSISYGLLYNWYAAIGDTNGDMISETSLTSSDDWTVPTIEQLVSLRSYIDPAGTPTNNIAGGKLKETGLVYWNTPNTEATNEYGFNARGAGTRRYSDGEFFSVKEATGLWSQTQRDEVSSYVGIMNEDTEIFYAGVSFGRFNQGYSIRLVSDATGIADGITTTYTGNDGKSYQAIAINELYWLSTNLSETKYRNGDNIANISDNLLWVNLTSGALCSYDNNLEYAGKFLSEGSIEYNLISGELPITVELIGSSTYTNNHSSLETGFFTDIPQGIYTFKIVDSFRCEESETVEINYSEPVALNSSYSIDRETLETCTVFKGFDYTVFGFTGEAMFDRVKIIAVPVNGTLSRGLLDTILVNDELVYSTDFLNGIFYRTSNINQAEYTDTVQFQVRVNGVWSNTAAITINVNSCLTVNDCVEYGYLYNWYAATDIREISSSDDWVVPSYIDFKVLADYLGAGGDYLFDTPNNVGGKLKEVGTTYWNSPNTGATNEVGFNGRGGGIREILMTAMFFSIKEGLILWNKEEDSGFNSYALLSYMTHDSNSLFTSKNLSDMSNYLSATKRNGLSIRLIKDSTTLSHGETGIYIGNDSKVYTTICIGTQEWVAANLAETQYRNGDPIPTVEDATTWAGLTTGAKVAYDNDYTNVGCDEEASAPVGIQTFEYAVAKQASLWAAYTYPYTDPTSHLTAQEIIEPMLPDAYDDYALVEYMEILQYSTNNADHAILYNGVEIEAGDKLYNNGNANFDLGELRYREATQPTATDRVATIVVRFGFINGQLSAGDILTYRVRSL